MDQKIVDLYNEYNQGSLDRREFFRKLIVYAGSIAAANAVLPLIKKKYAQAEVVPKDDPRLNASHIQYPGATGEVRTYIAQPKEDAKLPGVVVIHAIVGLDAHIEDVTRRFALERFLAIAPDALTPLGGTPQDPDKARLLCQKLDSQSTIKNYVAAVKYLKTHPGSTGKIGAVGFCWGGEVANQIAVNSPDLSAAVPYYGMQPASEDVPKIRVPLLLHYAGDDERINKGIPAYEEALKKASVDYRIYIYEDAQHGFNNDTNPPRYNKEAAQLAWQRTLSFLKEKLKK